MSLDVIVEMLRGAADFVGVARVVVDTATQQFGLCWCALAMCSASGSPVLYVDNNPDLSDDQRRRYVTGELAMDPLYHAVVATHGPAVGHDPVTRVHVAVLPLLDPHGLLGTIHCGSHASYSPRLLGELSVLASHVSVRLAQLGTARPGGTPHLSELSARQYEVARLVTHGLSNHQIAAALGISENTIKKHLKDVFARLGLSNRTELAARLLNTRPRSELPLGTSRAGSIVITRGE